MSAPNEHDRPGTEDRWWQQLTGETKDSPADEKESIARVLGDALRAEQRAGAEKVATENVNDLARARLLKLAAEAEPVESADMPVHGAQARHVIPRTWAVAAGVVALVTGALLGHGWDTLQSRPPDFQVAGLASDQWRHAEGDPVTVVWSTQHADRLAELFSGALLNEGAEFALRRGPSGNILFILPDGTAPQVHAALGRLGASPLPAGAVRVIVDRNRDGSP